jgi:hypothetical protein
MIDLTTQQLVLIEKLIVRRMANTGETKEQAKSHITAQIEKMLTKK